MKGLKKLALATAVAAAPFAQAELTSIDDALLSEMTGQAGITIDVDLAMTIDAIKYVDRDGNADAGLELAAGGVGTGTHDLDGTLNPTGDYEFNNVQGAITMKGLTIGSIDDATGELSAATIRGVTIDADGTDGLVIGLNQIGDTNGNGIDITVDAVMINNGNANLTGVNAAAAATYSTGDTFDYGNYASGAAQAGVISSFNPASVAAYSAGISDAVAQGAGYTDAAELQGALGSADPETAGNAAATVVGIAGGELKAAGPAASAEALALATEAGDLGLLQATGAQIATAGAGNIGGFKIENFRNYIQDDLVGEYNGVFDMALQDSVGDVLAVGGATGGRFVRGEIVINGTGNYTQGTSGLNISGEFGGAIDEAAWVDEAQEFGIADLGFFHGVDTDGDTVDDTIEGMHFTMDINVVDHESWNNATPGTADVAALEISGLKLTGTIMMGSLYLDSATASVSRQSLGSVLIKDIDMTGTSVFVYGH